MDMTLLGLHSAKQHSPEGACIADSSTMASISNSSPQVSKQSCCLQCANFVRSHKVWRHVTYPGGVVPQNEVVTQMQRLSVNQSPTDGNARQ